MCLIENDVCMCILYEHIAILLISAGDDEMVADPLSDSLCNGHVTIIVVLVLE